MTKDDQAPEHRPPHWDVDAALDAAGKDVLGGKRLGEWGHPRHYNGEQWVRFGTMIVWQIDSAGVPISAKKKCHVANQTAWLRERDWLVGGGSTLCDRKMASPGMMSLEALEGEADEAPNKKPTSKFWAGMPSVLPPGYDVLRTLPHGSSLCRSCARMLALRMLHDRFIVEIFGNSATEATALRPIEWRSYSLWGHGEGNIHPTEAEPSSASTVPADSGPQIVTGTEDDASMLWGSEE